jgi:hypothetical protein
VGTPSKIADELGAHIEVAVQRVYSRLLDMSDLEYLEFFATQSCRSSADPMAGEAPTTTMNEAVR